MKVFGAIQPKEEDEVIETPDGVCAHCEEPFATKDPGVIPFVNVDTPYHLECFMRTITGGIGCQMGLCKPDQGVCLCDPPGMGKRRAARLAYVMFMTSLQGTTE